MEAIPANRLGDLRSLALQAGVIGIDEGQFVSISILHFLPFCLELVIGHLHSDHNVLLCISDRWEFIGMNCS